MRESAASVFEFLAKDASGTGNFRTRKSGITDVDGEVLCAIDASGRPALLVPLKDPKDSLLGWHSKSLLLQTFDLDVDGAPCPFIILRCIDPKLNRQFGMLADDILDAIGIAPEKASSAVSVTLNRWRSLFEGERGALIGAAQLAGIMAELLVLQQLVQSHGAHALSAWQGPHGHRHDFVFGDCSLEVKATTNHNNMVVSIHGGRQLAAPDHGQLYLRAFQLERTPNGMSVPRQIDQIVDLGIPRLDLLTALQGEHYSEADATIYEETKFSVLSEKSFLVDEMFPRITAQTLYPPEMIDRLSNISYSVDLGQLEAISFKLQTVALSVAGWS